MKGYLVFSDKQGKVIAEVALEALPLKIGRAPQNQVVLNDSSISRLHAVIDHRDGKLLAIDQGSVNGIRANGQKLSELLLDKDCEFKLGEIIVRFTSVGLDSKTFTNFGIPERTKTGAKELTTGSFRSAVTGTGKTTVAGKAPTPEDLFSQNTVIRHLPGSEAKPSRPEPKISRPNASAPREPLTFKLPKISLDRLHLPKLSLREWAIAPLALLFSFWLDQKTWVYGDSLLWHFIQSSSLLLSFAVISSLLSKTDMDGEDEFSPNFSRSLVAFSLWLPLTSLATLLLDAKDGTQPIGFGLLAFALLLGFWGLAPVIRKWVYSKHQMVTVLFVVCLYVAFYSLHTLNQSESFFAFDRLQLLTEPDQGPEVLVQDLQQLFDKTAMQSQIQDSY